MLMHYVTVKVIITASILYVLLFSRINLAVCKKKHLVISFIKPLSILPAEEVKNLSSTQPVSTCKLQIV